MGYNTALLILNDGLGDLRDNPKEFTEGVIQAIHEGKDKDVAVGHHCNVVRVMATAHADQPRLYYSHGNLMVELCPWTQPKEGASDGYIEFLKDGIKFAKEQIKDLEKVLKEKTSAQKT